MLTHIVFYRLKDKSQESLDKLKEVFMSMQGKIEQLKSIEIGIDILHAERSYDLALVTRFESIEALNAYKAHPEHVKVSEYVHSVWKESASVDYYI